MPEESLHAHFDRLKKQLQESILRNYPNPERRGCPRNTILLMLARRPLDDGTEGDPNWQHVTHCAECYQEFLDLRAGMKQRQEHQRFGFRLAVAAAVVAVAAVVILANRQSAGPRSVRPQGAELIYRPRFVNLEGLSMTRSEKGQEEKKPILLGREPEALTIRLPIGSKAGTCEAALWKSADRPLFTVNGEAKIESGVTLVTMRVDLRSYEPGKYSFAVRQAPWDWTHFPAVIQ
jgi:hypothetical protein